MPPHTAAGSSSLCHIKQKALDLLQAGPKPQLIVLDLDYTLWRAFVDSTPGPPFVYHHEERLVLDRQKWEIEAFEHTRPLLQAFLEADLRVAFASRTEEPAWADQVIKIFEIDDQGRCLADYAHACEIYPTSKDKHLKALARKLDVGFGEMLFFDDERRNIHDVSKLGVVSVHCDDGISLAALEEGLRHFRERAAMAIGDIPDL